MPSTRNYTDLDRQTYSGASNSFGYGRYTVFFVSSGEPKIAIGPQWYMPILGMLILGTLGVLALRPLLPMMSGFQVVLYVGFLGVALVLNLLVALSNPGIVPRPAYPEPLDDREANRQFDCSKCKTTREDRAYHCPDCDACIREHDHHCFWLGKCIGRDNLKVFYAFSAAVPSFFIYVLFVTSMHQYTRRQPGI